jgi:hypothetical protein
LNWTRWENLYTVYVSVLIEYEPGKQKINSTRPRLGMEPATFAFQERRSTFLLFICDVNDINEFLPFHARCMPAINPANVVYDFFLEILLVM